ncbi:MAG: YciI family protein [Planctomycetaceae bacterium]
MKYMLLIYSDEQCWSDQEWRDCVNESTQICHELNARKQLLGAAPLHPVATATTVRVRSGETLITTGPFAETAEQLGGYYLIDVPDLDAAIAIAARLPPARKGTVEIRPVRETPDLPPCGSAVCSPDQKLLMFLCYDDEQAWTDVGEDAHRSAIAEAVGLTWTLQESGQYVSASPLHSTSTATSVRVRNGKRLITDGPFAETREVFGGYYLMRAGSVDEVVPLAARHPGVFVGAVEIREVHLLPPFPSGDEFEIVSSRDLPGTPEQIFAAFENPVRLAAWWGPDGFTNSFEHFDFRSGGEWRLTMLGPDGIAYPNFHVIETVEPDQKIVFLHESDPKFRLTVTLEPLGPEHTRVVWRMRFDTVLVRDRVAAYAIDCNEQMFERLAIELKQPSDAGV